MDFFRTRAHVMRTALFAGVVASLAASGLTTTASARIDTAVTAQLPLMPLPGSSLGSQVHGLLLAPDSGVVSNAEAASNANATVTSSRMDSLGRLSGYQLDYGTGSPSGASIYQVETGVEVYRSASDAARGLAFWRKDDVDLGKLKSLGLSVSLTIFHAPELSPDGFGDVGTATIKGVPSLHGSDVDFRLGNLIGMVSVSGADSTRLRGLALSDAHALKARMSGVLAGKITGPMPPSPKQTSGPLAGGPNLEALALKPSDFVVATVASQGYRLDKDLDPLSEYQRTMQPAGVFTTLQEQVALFSDPIQAQFNVTLLERVLTSPAGLKASGFNTKGKPTFHPRRITVAAGDEAFAAMGAYRQHNGPAIVLGYLAVRTGRTMELVIFGSPSTAQPSVSAVRVLAGVVAARGEGNLKSPGVA